MPATPDACGTAPAEAEGGRSIPFPADSSTPSPEVTDPLAVQQFDGRWLWVWRLTLGAVTVIAVVLLTHRLGAADLGPRLQAARSGWVVVAVCLSVLPVLGASLSLVALTPGRLPFGRTVAVQLATSFVNLVTPASAGGLALNVRYLSRRRVSTASAVAVVGIVQTMAVLVTAVLVLGLLPIVGRDLDRPGPVPWSVPVIGVATVLLLGLGLRHWAAGRAWVVRNVVVPTRRGWPQLQATLADPGRIVAATGGHLTVTMGFTGTLWASVSAFGGSGSVPLLTLVVVGSSAVAGAVPVPGGIGAAEAALLTGLVTVVGIDASAALSAVLLYRLVTFWSRVPIGWVALVYLRRHGDV